ncbi:eukaryotic translation initiation factor 2D [Homo sapiens]|uniref:Isoform 2 of Eukaryotic translation initiation factor 2D n=1 Tax=Homo sapiens TaxID=9606 RepID=P41214-2|nr:eukaryotic translation initiation factor 2D isoform 2 [Homo sapiens]EAW93540.1 ligatin, isoform CRA_e [Homo sapiens]KAI2521199.1 eukaryotic translation initiation factor 2D [Homo sapiens]KAI4084720.1 eukaryotic translation initiation factor 2D [Homo sapiens]|eukprot:NP_001188407.1 eukaryotic translation initiation factor 2D isoform 2 [Homo sapiens]
MFAKAFRVKSNTAIKGSDRRKLRADVTTAFPTLGTDQVSELVPGKEELNIVKLYAHKGDAVTVYVSGGNPILFELEKNLYPTVYTLWSYPDLLPTFTTWPLVLEKLVGGADLMLPGLVMPPAGLPQVQKGDLCAISLVGNRAPVAIGVAAMSTAEMLTSGLKGRGFSVLHTYQDHLCPEGRQLDIKKSSYKKLSKFLQQMQQEQIIQVKELSKGVESIVAVDWKHPRITSFVIPEPSPTSQTIQEGSREQPYHPPDIKPLYCVPASMTLLFQESGHKKGSFLEGSEVRTIVINYAKKNDLVDADNKNLVRLDPILCDCILEKNEQHTVMKLPWDSLLTRCLEKLQPAYQVTLPGQEPIVKKGRICPIDITLAQRASNKKVTVVRNLEAYGLDPYSVAAILQQRCQASTTVNPAPGAKDSLQVQIQGNQVHHLGWLLLEEYQLPRKHIQGLEKALKPGKKK